MRLRLLVLPAVLLLVSCTAGKPPSSHPELDVAWEGGLLLSVRQLGEENYAVYYKVNGARQIGFGGGFAAINRQIGWVGELSTDDYARLQEKLESGGWFDRKPEGSGEPKARKAEIVLRTERRTRRYTVKGQCAQVDDVVALLERASRERLQSDLDTLPEADQP